MAQNYEGAAECCIDDSETLNAAKFRAKQLAEKAQADFARAKELGYN